MIDNEITVLKKVKHPTLMELYEVFQEKDKLILICEMVKGQELYEYIKDMKRLEEKEAANIIRNVTLGLL
jgi:calcium/calmodulin-dependent protein kinase I